MLNCTNIENFTQVQLEIYIKMLDEELRQCRKIISERNTTAVKDNNKYYRNKIEKQKKIAEKLSTTLNFGDIVKVTGTRSSTKIRFVTEIRQDHFFGMHLKEEKDVTFKELQVITQHGLSKITHIFKDGKFQKILM